MQARLPEGFHTLTTYLIVPRVPELIEFLRQVFDAEVIVEPMKRKDGSVMHAEVRIGDSPLMMGEPTGEFTAMPASMYVYVDDADARYAKALEAGGASLMEPADQPHGDRYGGVLDPFGNKWWMAARVEELSDEEIRERYAAKQT